MKRHKIFLAMNIAMGILAAILLVGYISDLMTIEGFDPYRHIIIAYTIAWILLLLTGISGLIFRKKPELMIVCVTLGVMLIIAIGISTFLDLYNPYWNVQSRPSFMSAFLTIAGRCILPLFYTIFAYCLKFSRPPLSDGITVAEYMNSLKLLKIASIFLMIVPISVSFIAHTFYMDDLTIDSFGVSYRTYSTPEIWDVIDDLIFYYTDYILPFVYLLAMGIIGLYVCRKSSKGALVGFIMGIIVTLVEVLAVLELAYTFVPIFTADFFTYAAMLIGVMTLPNYYFYLCCKIMSHRRKIMRIVN